MVSDEEILRRLAERNEQARRIATMWALVPIIAPIAIMLGFFGAWLCSK